VTSRRPITRIRRVPGPPVAALRVWLRGGERHAAIPGQAQLAGRMLEEGSAARDWRRIAADAEARGVALHAFGGFETMGVGLDGPAAEVGRMVDWAAELVTTPVFSSDRWAWQRRLALAELAALADEPEVVSGWAFLRQLYGAHPRGRPVLGTPEALERLTVADSRESHRQALGAGAVVALAGALDPEERGRELEAAFALPAGPPVEHDEPAPAEAAAESRQVVPLSGDQAHLYLGRRTVDRDHADLPALELLAVILGAGPGLAGRIPERVREREGLAYTAGVDTAAGASADPGRLVLYAATSPDRVERAERAMREELRRLVDDGVTAAEVAAAKAYLAGQEAFRRETARQWADLMAEAAFTGIPIDAPDWAERRWGDLTAETLDAAARRWLEPDELRVTVGLPAR
jgi:zinc protease